MKFQSSFTRIYFNKGEDAPEVWSIDLGPGTVEIICYPCAWIEISGPHEIDFSGGLAVTIRKA